MTTENALAYRLSLTLASEFVSLGMKDQAMGALKNAMRAANKSRDARYRRAAFRALSFTRRIPAAV